MNVFILTFYSCVLFSVSFGGTGDIFGDLWGDTKETFFNLFNKHPASRSLYEFLDLDINPCDNFYQFSCGKWIKTREKKWGNSGSFKYNHRTGNFDKFVNGNIFFVFIYLLSEVVNESKYKDESRIFSTFKNLRNKCSQELPKDKVNNCLSEILEFGKYALSSVFLRRNMRRIEKNGGYEKVQNMYKFINEQFRLLIDEKSEMFDLNTRKYFLQKIDSLKLVTSLDDYQLSNVKEMEDCYYRSIEIYYKDHITTILASINNLKALSRNDDLTTCRGKIFQIDKFMYKFVYGNGMYVPYLNVFAINSDLVNEPSFSSDFPYSLNFGYLGNIMAHEMLHGFDSNNYNRTMANKISDYKVSQISVDNYEKKASCFVEQYNKQKENITNRYIDGSKTLGENIADNGGLKVAHRAYLKFREVFNLKNVPVEGFEQFNDEQLFFISVGRNFCKYMSKDILEKEIIRDSHTPPEIRTNVLLSNYKPFSDAFNCPLNSKMNPEHKCELWKIKKQN
uniref:Peptidase_M13 domain-containing protein n=1 Tax=Strongyloides papillosus TaxID=174720 RepID=A0A0N5B6V9_STREA